MPRQPRLASSSTAQISGSAEVSRGSGRWTWCAGGPRRRCARAGWCSWSFLRRSSGKAQVRDELVDVVVDRAHRRWVGAPAVAGEREQPGLRLAGGGRLVEDLPVARLAVLRNSRDRRAKLPLRLSRRRGSCRSHCDSCAVDDDRARSWMIGSRSLPPSNAATPSRRPSRPEPMQGRSLSSTAHSTDQALLATAVRDGRLVEIDQHSGARPHVLRAASCCRSRPK
jgi:hypothetical protein